MPIIKKQQKHNIYENRNIYHCISVCYKYTFIFSFIPASHHFYLFMNYFCYSF